MLHTTILPFITSILKDMPSDWLHLTTHRLDIYNESLAKTEFISEFENLYNTQNISKKALEALPTAYDYIRLGHPLSCVLEWTIAKLNDLASDQVISFSSETTPLLAVLRSNLFQKKKTRIAYINRLPKGFNAELIASVYQYNFEVKHINSISELEDFDGSTVLITEATTSEALEMNTKVDFSLQLFNGLGSIISIADKNSNYVSEIQHVRRRETIAMTPANCLSLLKALTSDSTIANTTSNTDAKTKVISIVNNINNTNGKAVVASSGLSMQYAIMMGLIDAAMEAHPNKPITFIVPTNCYGGTNDQARRVAACIPQVDVVDLQVDGDNDMVNSLASVLTSVAQNDAVPYIIAEIPTNPRVEVPDLDALQRVLTKERPTNSGNIAVAPVFILDQTFCPNVQFLSADSLLSSVKTIAYVSGSKFPSGGKCTAGYCLANTKAEAYMAKIEEHLLVCDNEATPLQYNTLAEQLPSMLQRIAGAYANTRNFVSFIESVLPEAKINFVPETLAAKGFTPSVFSLDLPTKGNTDEEREAYKRVLNLKLINLMITEIPNESKYCVSYGQLKGCYWTIPATSTQGTTKEGDKDYIARVAVSANLDLDKHKAVFQDFVDGIKKTT